MMAIKVRIPTILLPRTGEQQRVTVSASTVAEVITALESKFGGFAEVLIENGEMRRFINIYVNDHDIRFTGGLNTTVDDGDSVVILPAMAGSR